MSLETEERVPTPVQKGVEGQFSSTDVLEKPTKEGYEGYQESRGMLNRTSYEIASNVLLGITLGEKPHAERSSIAQANGMAERSKDVVLITEDEKKLYAVLRDKMPEDVDSSPDEDGRSITDLGDQELMAEAILIAGDTQKYEAFKNRYPNIFK